MTLTRRKTVELPVVNYKLKKIIQRKNNYLNVPSGSGNESQFKTINYMGTVKATIY